MITGSFFVQPIRPFFGFEQPAYECLFRVPSLSFSPLSDQSYFLTSPSFSSLPPSHADRFLLSLALPHFRPDFSYTFNLNPYSLLDSSFVSFLIDSFPRFSLRPSSFVFELLFSPSLSSRELPRFLDSLAALRSHGFYLALDDICFSDDVSFVLPYVSLLKFRRLDAELFLTGSLPSWLVSVLRSNSSIYRPFLVVEEIESELDFFRFRNCGAFDYWQGFWQGGVPFPIEQLKEVQELDLCASA